MAIIVNPVDKEIEIKMSEGEDSASFFIRPLDYKTKAMITGLTTKVIQGQVSIDSVMTCYYNIKYGLKKVKGLVDGDGKPYKLKFEDQHKKALQDDCLEEILAIPFSDNLQFVAREMTKASFPEKILHPLTGELLPGVEVVKMENANSSSKK